MAPTGNAREGRVSAVVLPVADRSFDMVLNTDGAVSFCGSLAEQAIKGACRVARRVLILAVSHRAWLASVVLSASVQVAGQILPAVNEMFGSGEWHQDQFPDNALLARGATQDYFGALKAFTPTELQGILEKEKMHVVRCGGLGTLSNLCGKETLTPVLKDEVLFQEFLDLCERFDREILPDGPGTKQRAGLVAVAVPR
mgnify:CR=1 FL=1